MLPAVAEVARGGLNGGSATLIFTGYFLAQIAVGLIAGFIGFAVLGGTGGRGTESRTEMLQQVTAIAALPTMLGSGLVMWLMALKMIRPQLKDTSPTGAAWVVGTLGQNLRGLAAGVLTAIGYAVLSMLFPPAEDAAYGPLAEMALTPGLQQLVWIIAALMVAPIVEECLFRGILYGGYRRSLGPVWAAVLSTLIFWMLHLTETLRYWPAMVAIAALALVGLWHRLRFSAVGPAVSVHVGYNGMIVLGAIAATLTGAAR